MKKIGFLFFSFTLVCFIASPFSFAQNLGPAEETKSKYLISFHTSIDYELIKNLESKIIVEYQDMPVVAVEISENNVSKLKDYPQIEFFEPDLKIKPVSELKVPAESILLFKGLFLDQKKASPQIVPWGIEKINALKVQEKGFTSKGIKIGIIDSGIDYTHDDLVVCGGTSFVEGNTDYMDDYGHGTAVAGIIGATNNHIGVAGIAPDSELFSIKVLDSKGDGDISAVISEIEWAVKNKINIINLSLETTTDRKTLKKAVKEAYKKGVLLVSAAGNNGFNKDDTIAFPAAYKEVIAVGAINSRNERTFYSSSGKDLELMAPGASIYSTSLNINIR